MTYYRKEWKMRTIKFRGKLKSNMNWEYGDLLHDDFNGYYIYPIKSAGLYKNNEVIHETVGQFTGLYDKNQNEIYEGDILDSNGLKIEVRFVRGVFALLCNGDLDEELCGDCRTDLFAKIIGNIYDNPELLKGGKK